ncbi:PREDICTED: ral guanine nucleotide dissociation stimulator [Condylura cristata]|uniref:ral guanine nucleotide dissociation stimulator n=1 Tax=Condylura cristata TaxID=143302 RepID=UPI00064352CD|nr:PREDICTED: ral guanine nucleotide dissociation stimulator [Condylura cristata]
MPGAGAARGCLRTGAEAAQPGLWLGLWLLSASRSIPDSATASEMDPHPRPHSTPVLGSHSQDSLAVGMRGAGSLCPADVGRGQPDLGQTAHLQTAHLQTAHLQTAHLQTAHLQTAHLQTGLAERQRAGATLSSTQEIGEELVNGVIYSISLRKVQVHQGPNKGQRWLGCESESALNLYETCRVRTVKAGTLERLVEHLVPAFQGSDLSYVTIFLCTYRAFTTTQRVLDLLFRRYGCVLPYSSGDGGPQDQLKDAISSILGTWLDQYSEDFCQPPDFPCLKQLVAYVQLNMPGSDLERRAHLLLAQLECRVLKNFSSLYAILSALQSNSIHRLKKTWEEVSRDSMRIFQKLSEIFSDENNYSLSRELLIKEGTSKFATLEVNPKRAQKRTKETGVIQGTVPYLGTFLTDLVMLDTAMKDYLYGRLINFEKRRKEFEVIAQIRLLQSACNSYSISPDRRFQAWFRLSAGGSAHSRSCDQLRCGPYLSSGDAADALSVHSAGSSSSDVEEINMSFAPESPDAQEKKFWESTSQSSPETSGISSASSTSSSSASTTPVAAGRSHKRSVSGVCGHGPALPLYNQQVGDCCIIRVSLDVDNGNMYKSILELKIPDNANVFYAMNSAANYDFVLKKRTLSKGAKVRHGASSTLPRMKQKGLKIAKGIF